MFPTDQATAASALPTPAAAGTQGYFTNGNPASGVAPTIVDADWLNMVQQELINVVLGGGIALSKTTYNQVLSAIKRICQNTTVLADTGAANAYTATNAVPLVAGASPTWVDGVVQAVKIAHANTTASTYAPDGLTAIPIYGLGLQPLQGGELVVGGTAILMHATISGVNSGNPICVLMECAGGAQQVATATQGQHAAQMQQMIGMVGSSRNLNASLGAAGTSLTFTGDEVGVKSALGGPAQMLANFNQTVSTTGSGIGGVVGTALAANGFAAIYAAYNASTGQQGAYVKNANSLLPNVDSSPPSGWVSNGLIAVWPLNGSTQFVAGGWHDRRFIGADVSVYNANGTVALSSLSLASAVPPNAKRCSGWITGSNTGASASGLISLWSNSAGTIGRIRYEMITTAANSTNTAPFTNLEILTAQTVYYTISAGTGTPGANIAVNSYEI